MKRSIFALLLFCVFRIGVFAQTAEDFVVEGTKLIRYRGTATDVVIPASLGITEIGSAFMTNIDIKSVVIPEGVTTIGSSAFYMCSNLTSVTIPASVTAIGISAFENCLLLESINIHTGITSVESLAFQGCRSLPAAVRDYILKGFGIMAVGFY